MFCSEHFTGKLDFFTSHFHYNLYLKWIKSIISYILSLWNLFETKIVANGALDPFKNLLYSSPENKFSITGELTAPWVKSLFILYSKIFGSCSLLSSVSSSVSHPNQANRTELLLYNQKGLKPEFQHRCVCTTSICATKKGVFSLHLWCN